jgi:hypothetical protein
MIGCYPSEFSKLIKAISSVFHIDRISIQFCIFFRIRGRDERLKNAFGTSSSARVLDRSSRYGMIKKNKKIKTKHFTCVHIR